MIAMGHDPLPLLPLLLWDTPPGLEMILQQEGIPFRHVDGELPTSLVAGRFVLFDSRGTSRDDLRRRLSNDHVAIDLESLREGETDDPFQQLVRVDGGPSTWRHGHFRLTETVHQVSRGSIRIRLIGRLREQIMRHGGLWARISTFPFPYRAAFNLRVDLDESNPEDYARFARSRQPLADCTTHFVSTFAYGAERQVLEDLKQYDTQSHGHFHHIYRDHEANQANLGRADQILRKAGLDPVGFASPHGRWNPGLDQVLEALGYAYSSEFQLGYDDLPFFPWCGGRFSRILQVPIHPVCEGLFFDQGLTHPWPVADYFTRVVRAKIEAGEPAFVYGHPERRLARYPEILAAVASTIEGESLLWRVTLTEFARWWRWRLQRRWSMNASTLGQFEIRFDGWDPRYPIALEIQRGDHVAHLPIRQPREVIRLDGLAYERQCLRADLPSPTPSRPSPSLRAFLCEVLDWEVVTPIDELPATSTRARLKRRLRAWRVRSLRR